ncbi:MAG: hypothetical protein LUC37_02750 [Prevotella sp.]|nr:hypothetical protein [Prevotella sp.]
MKTLNISKAEAIQVWLEDEGYLINDEQEALEKKAKQTRVTATIHQAKATTKTQRERVHKEDPIKEQLIAAVANCLGNFDCSHLSITNKSKTIEFTIDDDNYEFNLIRHRKPKK